MAQTIDLFIASDHAGFSLKSQLTALEQISDYQIRWHDLGPGDDSRVDYPDYADLLCKKLIEKSNGTGVLVCGSGQGMAIRANRYPQIRAALCWSEEVAELSRAHNNANVICMGSRLIPFELAQKILLRFLETEFEGGRHEGRVEKLNAKI